MKRISTYLLALLLSLPAGSALADGQLQSELATLLQWIVGEFDNQHQVVQGENFLRDGPLDTDTAPDLLYPVFAQVTAPALGEHVIYLQWAMETPDGPLQRQRIWTFRINPERNAVLMDFYSLREPERWRDAQRDPDNALREITQDDVVPYPPQCSLPFRRHAEVFIGEIPRGACRIVTQQTRTEMVIQARVIVASDQVWYDESGVREDGSVVFRVPASGSYQFRRR